MIPQFPVFKKLELADKDDFEKYTKQYPPYSDYNFVSIYSYDTEDLIGIAILNENLVIMFTDYITNKPFYSFIGIRNIAKTIETLLAFAREKNLPEELKLIPQINLKTDENLEQFNIFEDQDNNDYILSVDEIASLAGNKYRGKRNFVNRFVKTYGEQPIQLLDISNLKIQKEIEGLFFLWEKQKNQTRKETQTELTATKRLLAATDSLDLVPVGIYLDNKLVAFSIEEKVQENYAVIHFEKADTNYIGIFQYLKQATAKHMQELGCTYINYEQDLAIPGLRQAKQSWMPISYLKKYKIQRKMK